MSEKITIVEIAKLANVSVATVSRIVNNTGRVDETKRKTVLELIEKYNYKPNNIAKALQSSKSNNVGFIVPHINSPYFAQIFYETELIAQKHGLTLMLCNSESDKQLESKILNAFISSQVRAIVFMGGRLDDSTCDEKYIKEIEDVNKKIPIISCVDVPNLDCIQIFEEQHNSSEMLLKHLSEHGYRDISLAGGFSNVRTTITRRAEIIDNAHKFGISVRNEIIDSDYSVAGGCVVMEAIQKWDKLPDAIVCINDLVATGLLSELHRNNINVPKDIAVVGYDNLEISQFIYPGITTISTHYKKYANTIVSAIENIDQLDSNTRISLPRELIIRGTTQL